VTVLRTACVSKLFAVTVAPETTAPAGSVTLPEIAAET